MRKVLTAATMLLASVAALAGTLTLNGMSCGTITGTSVAASGDTVITTDSACKAPVIEPGRCEGCIDKSFPIVQQLVTLNTGKTLSIRFTPTAGGTFSTINTSSSAPNRVVNLSSVPGDMEPSNPRCRTNGYEVTGNLWSVTPDPRKCTFAPGTPIYANIRPVNCSGRCEILIRAN